MKDGRLKDQVRSNWQQAVLVCRKCSKKLDGGFGPRGDERLAKALRRHLSIKKGRKVERVSMMWLPKTMSGRRDAQNLIDQHSIVRRAKLRGDIPEMPVLVDFSAPAAER